MLAPPSGEVTSVKRPHFLMSSRLASSCWATCCLMLGKSPFMTAVNICSGVASIRCPYCSTSATKSLVGCPDFCLIFHNSACCLHPWSSLVLKRSRNAAFSASRLAFKTSVCLLNQVLALSLNSSGKAATLVSSFIRL